jgi:hypothetical protein
MNIVFASYNKGFKYLLTCIDVLSRYAWVVPLKDKTGKTLIEAFEVIFKLGVLLSRTLSPGENLHDFLGPFLVSPRDFYRWYAYGSVNGVVMRSHHIGTFYAEELQKVIKTDDVYKIETILKKRKKGRKVQYLVKWLGYPESFNSWIFKRLYRQVINADYDNSVQDDYLR